MLRLNASDPTFDSQLRDLLAFDESVDRGVETSVADILAAVKARGDSALLEYTARFDGLAAESIGDLRLGKERLQQALESIPLDLRQALELAAERVERYHQHQVQESWGYTEDNGIKLGQRIRPIQRVGLYVPGGKAAYPSTVLMDAIPAKVAGVKQLVVVTPTPNGHINDAVLAALAIVGVEEVYTVGGAQAVAALAFGTESIPRVDKIVGPGNVYVATAKRQVFGQVGLDMLAGPSEILVICDGKTDPDWIAYDLFSQAEHDENAQSILVSPDAEFMDSVQASIDRLLPSMSRKAIIEASLDNRGAMIQVANLEQAAAVSNAVAPEHLELSVEDPDSLLEHIDAAGAIFMGRHAPEAIGDYTAGPSHVLPTSGTARFASPLGVYDFVTRTSIIAASAESVGVGRAAAKLARAEGLEAHALSAEVRWP